MGIEQYCRKLQSPENGGCATYERRQLFLNNSVCKKMTWNEDKAKSEVYHSPGVHANCLASNPAEDNLPGKKANILEYVYSDHFNEEINMVSYKNFKAIVLMVLKNGNFTLVIRAFDKKTGELLLEGKKSTIDANPENLMIESVDKGVRVTCWPSIR